MTLNTCYLLLISATIKLNLYSLSLLIYSAKCLKTDSKNIVKIIITVMNKMTKILDLIHSISVLGYMLLKQEI